MLWMTILKKLALAAIPTIIDAGKKLLDKISSKPSVNSKSTVTDVEQVNMSLGELREQILAKSQPLIDNANNSLADYLEEQLFLLEDRAELLKRYNISSRSVEYRVEDIKRRTNRFWRDALNLRISLDDSRCREILMMPAGQAKADKISDFTNAVLTQTLDEYAELLRDEIKDLYADMEDEVSRSVSRLENKVNDYTELVNAIDERDDEKFERLISRAQSKIFVCDTILENFVKKAVSWVAEKVESAAKAVKEFFGGSSTQMEKETADVSRDIGQTERYEDYHTTTQVRNTQTNLNKYLEKYRGKGEEAERACKNYVNESFDAIIEEISRNKAIAEKFSMNQLERKKNRLLREIDGAIVNAIREHLSMDDYECREILNMHRGPEKGQRMREFVLQTINDARNDLADTVEETMNQVNQDISDFLKEYVETQEKNANSKVTAFKQWERDMQNQTFDRERAQLPARKKLYAIEQIEKVIAA